MKIKILVIILLLLSISTSCFADERVRKPDEPITEIVTWPELKVYEHKDYNKTYSKIDFIEIEKISVSNFDVNDNRAELTITVKTCTEGAGCVIMPLVFPCILK